MKVEVRVSDKVRIIVGVDVSSRLMVKIRVKVVFSCFGHGFGFSDGYF